MPKIINIIKLKKIDFNQCLPIFSFVGGMMLAIMICLLLPSYVKQKLYDYCEKKCTYFCTVKVNHPLMFLQICKVRGIEMIFLLACLIRNHKKFGIDLCLLLYTFACSLTFYVFTGTFGVPGILLVFLYLFPHHFLYFIILSQIMYRMENNNIDYLIQKEMKLINRKIVMRRIGFVVLLLLDLLFGLLLECYCVPYFVKMLYVIIEK